MNDLLLVFRQRPGTGLRIGTVQVKSLEVHLQVGEDAAGLVRCRAQLIQVFRLERGQWVIVSVYANDDEVRAEPFDATSLPLTRLWVD